ncbi:MAG: undecaprenyl-diphosphate phosphatase [Gemmatimonadetes bacterium]|nr:undecaprenyl-diphosphate phosphatase [Gemmatimonadota bacterium]
MTWYEGAFLGFLQGATEFLPVSSSGHLVMGQTLLGLEVPGAGLEVALHFATLVSVLVVYRARILVLLGGVARRDGVQLRYAGLLLLASIPAAVAGIGFGGFFESLFEAPAVTGASLLVTGCIVWTAGRALAREPSGRVRAGTAVAVGVAQAAAIVPGISRSGATVVTALWRGVDPREAAAFSFLMSVPVVAGAALLKLPGVIAAGGVASSGDGLAPAARGVGAAVAGAVTLPVLATAAVVACVTGVLAIRMFRAMLEDRSLHRFAPYLWAVGTLFLWFAAVR